MKKILFVFERLQVNGASKSLLALLNAIRDEYDVSLFLFSKDGEMIRELPTNIKVLPEIAEYKVLSQQMKVAVAEALRGGKFGLAWFRLHVFIQRAMRRPFSQWKKLPEIQGDWDVVCSYADGFIASVVTMKVAYGKKVLWVHENYDNNARVKSIALHNAFLAADAIVGVSHDAVKHIGRYFGSTVVGKTHVVHNIVDAANVKSLADREIVSLVEGAYNLVSVGRISHEKGYDLIPAILENLVHAGVNAHWTIIGPGLDLIRDSVVEDANRRGVVARIHFLGERSNPHPYTKVADCFVQLSRHEGWCMTISEALALGKPVVVSDLPVFHEQVLEGENGLFAHDVNSFAKAIQQLLCAAVHLRTNSEKFPFGPEKVRREFKELIDNI